MDKLDELFAKQSALQQKLNQTFNQEYINMMTLALIDELMEAIHETPWKNWKKHQTLNQENLKKELVDAWHFLINLTLASQMTSQELFDRYTEKNEVNKERKDKGY